MISKSTSDLLFTREDSIAMDWKLGSKSSKSEHSTGCSKIRSVLFTRTEGLKKVGIFFIAEESKAAKWKFGSEHGKSKHGRYYNNSSVIVF